MRCPVCDRENRGGARFCLKCGSGLALACARCGAALPPEAVFCDACGTRVGVAPIEAGEEPDVPAIEEALRRLVPQEYAERLLATRGQAGLERRVVTILFSDVKGSTALAEKLDPEDWLEIMDGAFDVLIEPVYRYEGTLARLMGDAVLAFFGAPIAHEDDPERACRAALDIIAGAQEYAECLERERGITGFNVRVGVHTGLVVVGEVGSDLRVEYTAMGDAVNLAARMEAAAQPGTVLITADTHKLIAPLFETEPTGPIEVKGKAEPVPAYRVLAPKEVPGKPRGIAGLDSPLVGREVEFAALREAVDRLQAGVGGIVTIVGEAGIGKSRLVAEVRKMTLAKVQKPSQGWSYMQWVEGRCLSYGTSIAYLLWLDVLRGLLGISVEDAPVDVRDALRGVVESLCSDRFEEVYPYLGRLMSLPLEEEVEARLRDLEGGQLRSGTFQATGTLLARAANERPLVLVCEDLHWADSTSVELLEELLPLTDRVPLLLVCVFRPQREHPCCRLRETIARDYRHRHTDLWLEPLSVAESERLVGNLLWIEDVSPELAEGLSPELKERILDHAEGNPFYLEEVLRSLIDAGAIAPEEATGRWHATRDVADIAIPDTLQGVLLARIDRLREEARRVLQMAAVIGRIFLHRVLAAIAAAEAAVEECVLEGELLTLQREEMIRERARIPELEYIFKHHLTQEAAYNGLLKRERRAYHRQVAEALERLFPERIEEQVGLLAHHWERAGDVEKTVEYLQRAGDQARLAYAHEEAVDYYERALRFLQEAEEHERAARTLMKLGLTYHNAFQFQQSRQAYDKGFALWQRAAETEPAVPPAPAPHSLRMVWYPHFSLDLAMEGTIAGGYIIEQLFSGLLAENPTLEIAPDVAQSWEVSDDGRQYVFHLRDDVHWSDGTRVTAGDFEYAWKRLLEPATGSPSAGLLYDVVGARAFHQGKVSHPGQLGVRALNDLTLEVELEEPTGHFLQLLACSAAYPVPRHVVEVHGESWTEVGKFVGNGPFRLEARPSEELLVLVRNPAYHGRSTGNVQRVELSLRFSQEWSQALLEAYEAGDLDVYYTWELPLADTDRARQRNAGEFVSEPWLHSSYLAFNASRPPFDDVRVRRAFVLASDRETLASVAHGGLVFPATGGFVPPRMAGHSPGIALPYDPEGARELLAEAGYPGGRGLPPLVYLTQPAAFYRESSEYLRQGWQDELGVEVAEEAVEWDTFVHRLDREPPDLFAWGWVADYPDPDDFLRVAFARARMGWRNPAYEGLVDKARRLTDQRQRMGLYSQADRILIEEAAVVPLLYNRNTLLVKPWVRKFPTSARGGWFWKDVVIEPH